MVRIIVIFRVGSAYEEYKKQNYEYYQSITHNTSLEIAWTVIPAGILVAIMSPSMALLYSLEEAQIPEMTLKVLGNQWY